MKILGTVLAVAVGLALATTTFADDTYKVDATHASAGFKVSHMVISKVKGHFSQFDADIVLDGNNDLTSAEATIQVNSIDTDNEKRDEHLKSPDFFDATVHPTIHFKSKQVTKQGPGSFLVLADFTIRDVTKEVTFPVTLRGPIQDPWGNTKVGFETTATIDRTEFGLTWSKALETGGLVVGHEVEITVDVEFGKQ